MSAPSKCEGKVADLEGREHVPLEDHPTEQAEPPPPSALEPEELDRRRLLGITGAGRLKARN